jgi:hypothetical protein
MKRRRWPKECPVFEVLEGGGFVRAGAVVEGVGLPGLLIIDAAANDVRVTCRDGFVALRIINDSECYATESKSKQVFGFYAFMMQPRWLRPLTPAARAMLRVVKP